LLYTSVRYFWIRLKQIVIFSKHNVYRSKKNVKKKLTLQSRGLFQGTTQAQSREGFQDNPTSTCNGMGGKNTGTFTRQIIRPLGSLNNIEQNTEDIFCRRILRINVSW